MTVLYPKDRVRVDQFPSISLGRAAVSTSAQPVEIASVNFHSEARFINRELSWLAFNERVLAEADNLRHPLLERLRFLSISANNLDEFYMVRVAGLKGQYLAGIKMLSQDGLTPAQQLEAIRQRAGKLMADQQITWLALRGQLDEAGIGIIDPTDLEPGDREWLEDRFMAEVFPVLTPLALDPAHPFPFVANRGFGLALELERVSDNIRLQALTLIPSSIDRFVRLPGSNIRFLPIEQMIALFLDHLFPGFAVVAQGVFRLLRDSEVEVEEEAEDLVRLYETALKRRRRGHAIHLAVDSTMPADLRRFLMEKLDAAPADVFATDGILGLNDTEQLIGRSGRRTSLSTILTRASTSLFSLYGRRRATRRSWRSNRPSIARARTARSCASSPQRPKPGSQ